jgi:hypothetical protein
MTVEQFVSIMTALTALIAAVGAVFIQVRATHVAVNSRMTELLDLTRSAGHAEGALAAGLNEKDSPAAAGES